MPVALPHLHPPTLQRAKALHPDLNTHLAPAQAQEAFLRLVVALEVLSDEQQRRLYDAATDPALPRVLRRAAAAQQQQAADAAAGGTQATQGAQAAHDAGTGSGSCSESSSTLALDLCTLQTGTKCHHHYAT